MANRLRILHLLTSLAPGGAETNLLALFRHFDYDRFEHAVAFGGRGALETEFAKTNVKLIRLSEEPLRLCSFFRLSAIIKRIEAHGPEIIHSHLDLPNVVGIAAKRRLRCKLVLHFHGLGIVPRSKTPGRNVTQWFWNGASRFYRYCDRAIAICDFQVPFLNQIGIWGSKLALIPNGINLDEFPSNPVRAKGDFRFISVARFYPQKAHDLLIRAFYLAVKNFPHMNLLLVGDGPLRASIEQQVKALGLQDKVTFTGVRHDVPELLDISHCFVLSSRWELQPITILEAMRAGLPVIATNVGGVGDTVIDGVTGILVKPNDEIRLAKAMLSLATNPERSIELGVNGLKIVAEQFSNERVAVKIEDEYLAVLKSYT